jgi:hypothetical protein
VSGWGKAQLADGFLCNIYLTCLDRFRAIRFGTIRLSWLHAPRVGVVDVPSGPWLPGPIISCGGEIQLTRRVSSSRVKDRWFIPTMLFMPSVTRLSSVLIALLCLANAAPVAQDNPTSIILGTVTPPDKDEFYRAPSGFEKAPLGAILKQRPTPNPIAVDNKTPINLKAAWQILYRTQNSVGKAEATVVTVLVPHNARPSNLMVYSYWTVCVYPLFSRP